MADPTGSNLTESEAKEVSRSGPVPQKFSLGERLLGLRGDLDRRASLAAETLAANKTLTADDPAFQGLDPNNVGGRDVILPPAETGLLFVIVNRADAAENLTIKDAAGNTHGVLNQNEGAFVMPFGNGWGLLGFTAVVDLSA